MSEERTTVQQATRTPGMPVRRPFPLTRVLVALFGIAAGVWLWLGSGWRWDVTPSDLTKDRPPVGLRTWVGRYVRLRGLRKAEEDDGFFYHDKEAGTALFPRIDAEDPKVIVWVKTPLRASRPEARDRPEALRGRIKREMSEGKMWGLVVDTAEGRFSTTSIIAVLVALWGAALICFNVALWARRSRIPTATAAKPPARPPVDPDDS